MILVLTGSPNISGNTNTVINDLLKDVKDEVVIIDAYFDPLKACTDCKFCSYKSGCSIKDKMFNIYQLIEKTDTLIIASPLHFATFSAELISLMSRFQTYYYAKYVRKQTNPKIKKAILIVTAGGYWSSMFVGVKETFNVLKHLFSIDETKTLLIPNCDTVPPLISDEYNNNHESLKAFISNKTLTSD
ncbi:MAG: NADPH-dependent reductase [Haloplasmataceae bacterium]|jgi:multimeric flavodoxin WrbA|nr:NADPH-dependent reductase [Haloplasmataceae bacterium]